MTVAWAFFHNKPFPHMIQIIILLLKKKKKHKKNPNKKTKKKTHSWSFSPFSTEWIFPLFVHDNLGGENFVLKLLMWLSHMHISYKRSFGMLCINLH